MPPRIDTQHPYRWFDSSVYAPTVCRVRVWDLAEGAPCWCSSRSRRTRTGRACTNAVAQIAAEVLVRYLPERPATRSSSSSDQLDPARRRPSRRTGSARTSPASPSSGVPPPGGTDRAGLRGRAGRTFGRLRLALLGLRTERRSGGTGRRRPWPRSRPSSTRSPGTSGSSATCPPAGSASSAIGCTIRALGPVRATPDASGWARCAPPAARRSDRRHRILALLRPRRCSARRRGPAVWSAQRGPRGSARPRRAAVVI